MAYYPHLQALENLSAYQRGITQSVLADAETRTAAETQMRLQAEEHAKNMEAGYIATRRRSLELEDALRYEQRRSTDLEAAYVATRRRSLELAEIAAKEQAARRAVEDHAWELAADRDNWIKNATYVESECAHERSIRLAAQSTAALEAAARQRAQERAMMSETEAARAAHISLIERTARLEAERIANFDRAARTTAEERAYNASIEATRLNQETMLERAARLASEERAYLASVDNARALTFAETQAAARLTAENREALERAARATAQEQTHMASLEANNARFAQREAENCAAHWQNISNAAVTSQNLATTQLHFSEIENAQNRSFANSASFREAAERSARLAAEDRARWAQMEANREWENRRAAETVAHTADTQARIDRLARLSSEHTSLALAATLGNQPHYSPTLPRHFL